MSTKSKIKSEMRNRRNADWGRIALGALTAGALLTAPTQAQTINTESKSTQTTERGVRVIRGPVSSVRYDRDLDRQLAGGNRVTIKHAVVVKPVRRQKPPGLVVIGQTGAKWRINGSHGQFPNRVFGIVPKRILKR